MSYNILADSFMETRTKPVVNHFPWCPKKFQKREYREPRIAAEIRAHDPDIVCMQEVCVASKHKTTNQNSLFGSLDW